MARCEQKLCRRACEPTWRSPAVYPDSEPHVSEGAYGPAERKVMFENPQYCPTRTRLLNAARHREPQPALQPLPVVPELSMILVIDATDERPDSSFRLGELPGPDEIQGFRRFRHLRHVREQLFRVTSEE